MKPDKLTVHDLFQRERRYVVPLYQRSYVWNRDEQWEPLWEDIERSAEACLAAENHVARRSHFLGAIVLNVAKIVGSSVARSEIIDGQQRLTTLQLFLAALRDYAVETSSSHAAKLFRLTVNEDEKPGSEGSFKVWPTNSDRELFRSILTARSPTSLLKALGIKNEATAPRLAAGYFYFAKAIRDFVNQGVDDTNPEKRDQRIFGLLQAFRTALQLVVIELEENDDPQVIFEALNARGQPLLPSDLIRNFVFLQAANDPNIDADELYNQYWRSFDDRRQQEADEGEDRFWHVAERQGRLTRPRIDLFIFHYLVMKTERELNIGQLFREFRDWYDEHPQPIETFLADLKAHSGVFAELVMPAGHDRVALFAQRLKALDTSTVYPFLLFLLSLPRDRLSLTDRDQVLADLESWLVRRLVCQLTNKNYNRFFVLLLSKVKNAPTSTPILNVVRAELTRSLEPTLNWPDDKEFKVGWLSKSIYVKSRPDRSAMILRAIEAAIRTSKNEAIILPEKLSVEHLLPQRGTLADYPFPATMPLQLGENPERCRKRLVDSIGNLTLLTQELNSSVSNGAFAVKSKAIAADSDLRLNAWLRDRSVTSWSEDAIVSRGEKLFVAASLIWKHPGPVSSPQRATTNKEALVTDHLDSDRREIDSQIDQQQTPSPQHGRGDAAFLAECRVQLAQSLAKLGEDLLQAVRQRYRGELREGQGRKWVNHPANFFAITIQPRDESLAVHIKAKPNEVQANSLDIVQDRSYSRFKLTRTDQSQDAIRVVLEAGRRANPTLDDLR